MLRFLTRTGAVLASAADPDAAFRQLARLLVEEGFCDACYFDVVDETLHVKRVAWAHRRPEKQAEYDVLWPKVRPRPYLDHPAAAMIANEQPIFTPVVDEAWMRKIASGEAHLEYMRREHIRSVIVVPLMTLSTPYGAITLNLTEDPVTPYTEFDLALAMELGWRCAFAISNGRKQAALQKLNADLETEVLRRTKERDRIWSVSNDLMSVAGADGYLKSVNPAWSRVLGYDEATLLSTPFMQLGAPGAQSGGLAVMARLENGESITRYESRLRHADGSYRWFDWKVVPEDGLYYAVGRDITEERARAAELETSNRELQRQIEERERVEGAMREMQRLEAVGQLTAGVAHDFNNLLQIITGTVSLLDRDVPADSAQGRRLQNIKLAAQRGSKLTSQLLAFARRQNLVPQDIDIRTTLEGMEELLRTTMGPDVSVSLALPDHPVLRADPTQFELVLINLTINARDAMDGKGQLTVAVGTEEVDAPLSASDAPRGRYIAIAVSDTGTGMAPDVAERAFEPFFTTKPVGRGSGLGLSQVVGFAKQSGGG
ncbi:MAG: PAS domain S-box protein, partial [Alphaproteobacteria bacterium]|nr:PAS domain S-box protein [Alphaproteobacteria bacterium]